MSTIFILSVLLVFFNLQCPSLSAEHRCHPEDKKVLLKIKKHWGNPHLLDTWNPKTDCCEWYRVSCLVNINRVFEIYISYGDLPGPIPPFIADLPYLESIDLHGITNLTGPIPSSITKLNLNYLRLDGNGLTGTIPDFLGQLKNLTYLNLSFDKFTGSIPASLVNLKGNNLFLILSHNQLSGDVPATFGEIDFQIIDLSDNKLEGDISMLFGQKKTAYSMDFSKNMFAFDMSKLKLHKDLAYLDLNHNKIYGSLPKAMVKLEWQLLNVSYNRLCGEIPQGGILQSKFDYSAFFHNRCLCGAPLNVTCK